MKRLLSLIMLLALCVPAWAADGDKEDEAKGTTGLPLPRYAALRTNEVNLRTGPGTRYPIEWVFVKQGLPVEITAEYEIWRRVRDSDGAEGWVHKTALSGKRAAIVVAPPNDKTLRDLYRAEDLASPVVAHLEPGAIGQLLSCAPEWCRMKFDDVKGYLRKTEIWGVYPNEVFD